MIKKGLLTVFMFAFLCSQNSVNCSSKDDLVIGISTFVISLPIMLLSGLLAVEYREYLKDCKKNKKNRVEQEINKHEDEKKEAGSEKLNPDPKPASESYRFAPFYFD